MGIKGRIFGAVLLLGLISGWAASANAQECLIVRSAEGHRFRNSMIAGALTGGIGFAAGAAFSGAKYEYVDGINVPAPKLKYKGSELEKLEKDGVHIVVINKKAQADEAKSARESCQEYLARSKAPVQSQTPSNAPTSAAVPQPIPVAVQPTKPTAQPEPEQSLGDAARKIRKQKEKQESSQQ
jgi:hypothetical protein